MLYLFNELGHTVKNITDIFLRENQKIAQRLPYSESLETYLTFARRFTREYPKPDWNLPIEPEVVLDRPFCRLIRFNDHLDPKPKVLFVAPMSGHWATLIRSTVEEFLYDYDVYVTDWKQVSDIDTRYGVFCLDTYIREIILYYHYLHDANVIAVCQPGVPVLAASIHQDMVKSTNAKKIALLGSPIDTRINPNEVNKFAESKDEDWFERHMLYTVSLNRKGAGRKVYPGFIQLHSFMSMNLDKHIKAYHDYFDHLTEGDDESVDKHEQFYNEYLSVMDIDGAMYMDTITKVFKEHHLPTGKFVYDDVVLDPAKLTTPIIVIEGENDDITSVGQTKAVFDICPNIPKKDYVLVPKVGHYGIFNGKRFKEIVAPRIKKFFDSE